MIESGMINKIEKAKIYAEESSDRIDFESLRARVQGDNNDEHVVTYEAGQWACDCGYFTAHKVCSHTMAIERILRNMVELGEYTP